jgi:Carboxypeptidase regulatory-like domain
VKVASQGLFEVSCSQRSRFSGGICAGFLCVWCIVLAGLSSAQVNSSPYSQDAGSFTLEGTVVNSVTGEPVARALVRIYGVAQRSAFTDSEGHFQIAGLPAGSTSIELQKPGYSTQQDSRTNRVIIGAETGPVVLKLSPLGAIYGRVLDVAGQPIENVPLRLIRKSVRDGRLRWDLFGSAGSDEDGRFRFQSLTPGSYYLAAGPGIQPEVRLLARDPKPKTGYPSLYYPNAPDLSSASPIQLVAGQQAEADFSMPAVPVYHISGTLALSGYLPEGFGLQILNQSGENLSIPTRLHLDTGTFDIDAIPAGSYVLKAISHVGNQALRAETHLSVAANLDNVALVLAPAPAIPITVRMESRDASNLNSPRGNQQRPPVSVRLIPAAVLAAEPSSNLVRQGSGQPIMALQDVEPGRYAADVLAWGQWYVQSAQYGPTNLLFDDVTIAPGHAYPIEIVLRDDGATLTGNLNYNGVGDIPITFVVAPQPAARRGIKVLHASQHGFGTNGFAPGDYLVYAFDHAEKLEYTNPDALEPYASQATAVTLSANQETSVVLNLIHTGEGE